MSTRRSKSIICHIYGKVNNNNTNFCITCARPLSENSKNECPFFEMKNHKYANYCQECGSRL
ncbi:MULTISPECIES: hypothetical protein [Methanobacterium]|uniref:DZANK-type domain-containing protein n=1 Tax=Methanobacterium veterum TaxID=408577 RepID=A0A9E5A7Z8_9EURY|nr:MULTISPECIES: hypothetical protein [Methanobacterium]MCZ3374231.1 hypothetical protein [Methanobacterium veterum]